MRKWQRDDERSVKPGQRSRSRLLAAAEWTVVVSVVALALTALLALQRDAESAAPFNPTFDVSLSDDAAGANADVTSDFAIPAPEFNFDVMIVFTPPEFGLGAGIPIGARVAHLDSDSTLGLLNNVCVTTLPVSFNMLNASTNTADTVSFDDGFADLDGNTLPDAVDKYHDFLNTMFPGLTPLARFYGQASVAGTPVSMNLVIFEPGTSLYGIAFDPGLGYPAVSVLNDPTAAPAPGSITDFCTPVSESITTFGISKDNPDTPANEGGYVVSTNPTTAGDYTFTLYALSQGDADDDGIENDLDTCPFDVNEGDPRVAGSGDSDNDGIDNACDPEPDVANTDVDDDVYLNRGDNCPLMANPDNADSDGDRIGDVCDTEGNGPNAVDGVGIDVTLTATVTIADEYCDPIFPGTYAGDVTLGGSPAPNGTEICATIEGIEWACAVTTGGHYVMDIPETLPVTPPCFEGGSMTFYADGLVCEPVVEWAPGLHQNVNLVCGAASFVRVDQGISVEALGVLAPGVGAFTINATYNPSSLTPLECSVNPEFDVGVCNPDAGPSTVVASGIEAECGLSGRVPLATMPFEPIPPVCPDDLTVTMETFASCEGGDIPVVVDDKWWVGDVDRDFDRDAVDALFILQYVVNMRDGSDQCPPPPGAIYLPGADADCDGDVDAVDALFVLQHVVGLRPVLCPGP